jgi:hypothetical protein
MIGRVRTEICLSVSVSKAVWYDNSFVNTSRHQLGSESEANGASFDDHKATVVNNFRHPAGRGD